MKKQAIATIATIGVLGAGALGATQLSKVSSDCLGIDDTTLVGNTLTIDCGNDKTVVIQLDLDDKAKLDNPSPFDIIRASLIKRAPSSPTPPPTLKNIEQLKERFKLLKLNIK